jgi:hypothetical protein
LEALEKAKIEVESKIEEAWRKATKLEEFAKKKEVDVKARAELLEKKSEAKRKEKA